MATTRILLGISCLVVINGFGKSHRNLLAQGDEVLRTTLVNTAKQEIGTRERTNHNDGKRVEEYLHSVGLKAGQPYCAAFVSWAFMKTGFAAPRSGWSPDLFPNARLARSALPGTVLGIYFPELKRIAHVGLVVKQEGDWIISTEANTNVNGSREGDGVYLKRRHIKTISKLADWIKNGRRLP